MIDLAHVHPMLVHFPLVLLPLAAALYAWTLLRGGNPFDRSCASKNLLGLLWLAALSALAAAAMGDVALDIAIDKGVPDAQLEDHEDLGFLTAWASLGLVVLQSWFYARKSESSGLGWLMMLATLGMMGLVLTTAFFGGHLVYDLGVNVG